MPHFAFGSALPAAALGSCAETWVRGHAGERGDGGTRGQKPATAKAAAWLVMHVAT